jgi:hypothetical protein
MERKVNKALKFVPKHVVFLAMQNDSTMLLMAMNMQDTETRQSERESESESESEE